MLHPFASTMAPAAVPGHRSKESATPSASASVSPESENAAFSLSGETDADADGVADSLDLCPGTPVGAIVDDNGCSIDQIAPCSGPASGGTWKNHGQYVSAVAHAAEAFLAQDLISEDQADEIVAQAAQSNCGAASR